MIRQQFKRGSDKREQPYSGDDEKPEPSGRGSDGGLEQPDETYQYQELPEKGSENRQEQPRRISDEKQERPRRGSDKKQERPRRESDKRQEQPGRGSG